MANRPMKKIELIGLRLFWICGNRNHLRGWFFCFSCLSYTHNADYVVFLILHPHKSHSLHLSAMGWAIFYGIDSGSIYIAVSEYVGQANDIFLQRVVCSCKQMAEVMWEHFFFWYSCGFTQLFHRFPDWVPVHRPTFSCYEYTSRCDMFFLYIFF